MNSAQRRIERRLEQREPKHGLVVVDMQPPFESSEAVLWQVVAEVRRACKKLWPIWVLEYWGNGSTNLEIRRLLENYPRVQFLEKEHNDGSPLLKGIKQTKLRVCGVNTCYCVGETVAGLLLQQRRIEWVLDACNCNCSYEHTQAYLIERIQRDNKLIGNHLAQLTFK